MVTPNFNIEIRTADGVRHVAVSGELDLATAPALAGELSQACALATAIDLAGVTFLDARGLRVLISAYEWSNRSCGPGLRLVRPSQAVRRLFELTGTLSLLATDAEAGGGEI
jgi:anti-anti-sigma factor